MADAKTGRGLVRAWRGRSRTEQRWGNPREPSLESR